MRSIVKSKKEKIHLKIKLDRLLDAFLYRKGWRKSWDRRFRNLYWYYRTPLLLKFFEKMFHYKLNEFNLYALGQSHLDACWKWTKLSSIRRAILTFERAIKNLKKYPHFIFSQTSPQYYDWIKKFKPRLFDELKKLVEQGKFELIGGMWIEPDANLPSGESFVRQRFYGQLFYLENFGKLSKIAALPDSFGFSGNLPQIFTKSGAEYFWTTKITWNDYNRFPFANFLWQGVDGSSIFTHCFVYNVSVLWHLSKYKELARQSKKSGLVFNSTMNLEEIKSQLQENYVRTCGIFYGFGDGAMGPFEEEITLYSEIGRLGLLKFTTIENFFKILKKECNELIPIWNDELYLENHRACYTSQSNIKKLNRLAEINLRNFEILNTFFTLLSKTYEYPMRKSEDLWKTVLFNQFHDILPGSSIQDVYYEQEPELYDVIHETKYSSKMIIQMILFALIGDKSKINDNKYLIFNSLSWTRDGTIKIENEEKYIEYQVKRIPALSFKIVDISLLKNEIKQNNESLIAIETKKQIILENKKIKLTIDKNSGKISSLISKIFKKEFIRLGDGIGFHVFRNKPQKKYCVWNIDKRYSRHPIKLGRVKGLRIIKKNIRKIMVKLIFLFKNSKIIQYIILRTEADYIEFRTEMEIFDKNMLFKIKFPFHLNTNELICEIPYGSLKRKIVPETEFEKAKWEFPAQKWVAISDQNYGIVLANDSKYGFNSTKKGLYMTLLNTPHYPTDPFFSYIKQVPRKEREKYIDQGHHIINYALKIFEGDWVKAEVWKFGYEFNYPLLFEKIKKDYDNQRVIEKCLDTETKRDIIKFIQKENSLIEISEPNIILEVIKPHETIPMGKFGQKVFQKDIKEGLILRLYETTGKTTSCHIKFNDFFKLKTVFETDLLELDKFNKNIIKILDNREFNVNFTPFEIKTLQIKLF